MPHFRLTAPGKFLVLKCANLPIATKYIDTKLGKDSGPWVAQRATEADIARAIKEGTFHALKTPS